jgi:cell division septum initiation protein DivIVA
VSARPANAAEAAQLEDALVRRVFSMANTLLRQATTTQAAAFDPAVVGRHSAATLELAGLLNQKQGAHHG